MFLGIPRNFQALFQFRPKFLPKWSPVFRLLHKCQIDSVYEMDSRDPTEMSFFFIMNNREYGDIIFMFSYVHRTGEPTWLAREIAKVNEERKQGNCQR